MLCSSPLYYKNVFITKCVHGILAVSAMEINLFCVFVSDSLVFLKKSSMNSVDFNQARSQNCEKRPLASSCVRLSVHIPTWNYSTPTGGIFVNLIFA